MDKFIDTLGAVATGAAPIAAVATFALLAGAVVLGAGLMIALPRIGKMLHVPQYQPRRQANYLGTPAE